MRIIFYSEIDFDGKPGQVWVEWYADQLSDYKAKKYDDFIYEIPESILPCEGTGFSEGCS